MPNKVVNGMVGTALAHITNKTNRDKQTDGISVVFDREWLKGTFIINDEDAVNVGEYGQWIKANRYSSTADLKFTSTAPGMSVGVNPKPQFTRYADIRNPGKLRGRPPVTLGTRGHPEGLGMGNYYSMAIDDNQQRIFMRFGTPQYMSMLLWLTKSFDVHKAALQNRGLVTSTFLEGVNLVTKFFAITASPWLFAGKILFNMVLQPGRFVSVRDNMYTYWATVENILNTMTVRRTMAPHILSDFTSRIDNTINQERSTTSGFVQSLNDLIPDVIDAETGRISVFAIALRGQSAFNRMLADDLDRTESYNLSSDFTNYPITGQDSHDTYFGNNQNKPTLFIKHMFHRAYKLLASDSSENPEDPPKHISMNPLYTGPNGEPLNIFGDPNEVDPDVTVEAAIENNRNAKKEALNRYGDFVLADLSEGMAFAVFNVDNTGSVGESFSNSTASNPIETVFNSISSKSRSIMNNVKSLTDIPLLSDTVGLLADTAAITVSNASFGLANPLLALAYGATISLPKAWESSSASLPRASYKMKLISPYGNAYSQLFNIYMPLAMIMAGALPRSTGLDSHTSPFLCQLYDRGRVNIPLGIIDSFSVTRGTSNLAFSRTGNPNAIDVDFSVTDLNEVISVDVNSSGYLSRMINLFDVNIADNSFTNYINTVTGVDVYSQFYRIPAARLKMAERVMTAKAISDPAALAGFTVNSVPLANGVGKLFLGNNQKALQDLVSR